MATVESVLRDFSPKRYGTVDVEEEAEVKPRKKKEAPKPVEAIAQPVVPEKKTDDPVLAAMGESTFEALDDRRLLYYFANKFEDKHGYPYKIGNLAKEEAIIRRFRKTFDRDAGPMIQLIFDEFDGKWNDEIVTCSFFSQNARWMHDQVRHELQKVRKRQRKTGSTSERMPGMSDSGFLKQFAIS